MGLPSLVRPPFTVLYRFAQTVVHWGFGIMLCYSVELGRRVRIWHHGGIILNARRIGNDVQLRQNTTMGVARLQEPNAKPIVEDRVEIGCGAVLLGQIRIGHDSIVGANAVVTRDVPPHVVVAGVPARIVKHLEPRARLSVTPRAVGR